MCESNTKVVVLVMVVSIDMCGSTVVKGVLVF